MVDLVINIICIAFTIAGIIAIALVIIDLFRGDEKND